MEPVRLHVFNQELQPAGIERQCAWSPDPVGGPPSCWRGTATDREKLAVALQTLRRYGIAAGAAQFGTPEQIADRLIEQVRSRFPFADGACVCWTADEQARCFSSSGQLLEPLTMHAYGPGTAEAAIAALERAGLTVWLDGSPGVVSAGGGRRSAPVRSIA